MAQAYCGERISQHLIRDNAGFLVAISQPICRSGWQAYKMSEIDAASGDESMVQVYRPPEEVTSAATIASAEGKPITMRHPAKFLDSNTVGWSSRGHIQNVRVGPQDKDGNVTLVADLHIHDGSLIDQILSKNLRDISMGYLYSTDDGPREGTLCQRNIRMNHCAVVESGRAGTTYITDANEDKEDMDNAKLDRLCDLLEKLLTQSGESEAEDDDPEAEYELAAGPERKLKSGPDLIPVNGAGAEGNVNPLSARDARAALQSLRNLRGFIEANGDRKAKDAYNSAVKAIRVQIAAADSYESLQPRDLRSRRQSDAAEFERRAASFHGKTIKVHGEMPTDEHRAEDASQHEESFEEACARVGREQQARFTPKKRR